MQAVVAAMRGVGIVVGTFPLLWSAITTIEFGGDIRVDTTFIANVLFGGESTALDCCYR
jgi:hypothetical protein